MWDNFNIEVMGHGAPYFFNGYWSVSISYLSEKVMSFSKTDQNFFTKDLTQFFLFLTYIKFLKIFLKT